jgi:TolB-like protein
MSLFEELKRRNVFRVTIAYVLLGWAVLQGADFMLDLVGAPEWVIRVFAIAGLVGFPFVVFFAWAFELTPEGIKREREVDRSQSITPQTGRRLDRMIILFLAVAVAFLLVDRFFDFEPAPQAGADKQASAPAETRSATQSPAIARHAVAVLPFMAMSSGQDDEYFADGLTEEILNSLAQLPELLVTARTSAFALKGQELTVQEIATKLGVSHVVEGSVRRSGDRLRVTAQLIRADDGFHLWSENYDSVAQDTIQVQEDIAEKIAAALNVVMDDTRREAMRRAGLRDVEAFIALQKGYERFESAHGEEDQVEGLKEANRYFDKVLEKVPRYPPALIYHADAYIHFIDSSTWEEVTPEIRQQMMDAQTQAVSDYLTAAENARNFEERAAIEFDLAVITGNLRGIQRRLQAYLATDDCEHPSWIDPIATVFGYAEQLDARLEAVRACDPLAPTTAFSQARAALWAGHPERALEIATQAREKTPHSWLDIAVVQSLMALGRIETSASEVAMRQTEGRGKWLPEIDIAAIQGDRERGERLLAKFRQAYDPDDFFLMQIYAKLGDREEADQIAARVDQRALGPLHLILATLWCACGAPFDLEATPKFAAKLEEGGLPWPPSSPMSFPLKDW